MPHRNCALLIQHWRGVHFADGSAPGSRIKCLLPHRNVDVRQLRQCAPAESPDRPLPLCSNAHGWTLRPDGDIETTRNICMGSAVQAESDSRVSSYKGKDYLPRRALDFSTISSNNMPLVREEVVQSPFYDETARRFLSVMVRSRVRHGL